MLDRTENDVFTELTEVPYEHAGAVAATVVHKLRTVTRPMRVERVEYILPAGYTGHASAFYTIELRKGTTVIASWSCDSDVVGQGTITADTLIDLVLSATDTDRVCDAGDVLSLALVKTGAAANLPLGRLCAHCKFV